MKESLQKFSFDISSFSCLPLSIFNKKKKKKKKKKRDQLYIRK